MSEQCGPCRRGQHGCCDENHYLRCDCRHDGRAMSGDVTGHRLGARVVHEKAGKDSAGRILTICGRAIDTSDPRYRVVPIETVPLEQHCLGCWR
jgi:hypothetical protein